MLRADSLPSKATLRTRTGCYECRTRRKKCDEQRPTCGRCCRSCVDCTWPTSASQPPDGRRRSCVTRQKEQQQQQQAVSILSAPPPPPASHFDLYRHFATAVTPRLVRQNCLSKYADQSYILQLALEFPPLMNAMVAIAALDKATDDYHNRLAVESYVLSISSLRSRIARAQGVTDQDGLLATTICLCVFENSRNDTAPTVGPHAAAAGVLLARRKPGQQHGNPEPASVFERICAESFLYHSALLMLFDASLDVPCSLRLPLERYFSDPSHPTEASSSITTQPILEESYKFFLLIADVTRLARIGRPLDEAELLVWHCLRGDLQQWENHCRQLGNHGNILYILAMRVLLVKMSPAGPQIAEQMSACLDEGLHIMTSLDEHRFFVHYLLWPFVVLGSIALEQRDQRNIDEWISHVATVQRGRPGSWARSCLRRIWAREFCQPIDSATLILRRLQMLVEGP